MKRDIGLINKYVLLSKLYYIQDKIKNDSDNKDKLELIFNNFKIACPEIDVSDLKEVYHIPVFSCIVEEITYHRYNELAKPHMAGYEELLKLNQLCAVHLYPLFATMVGDTFYSIKDFNSVYEVVYIQEDISYEQIIILCCFEKKVEKLVKLDEWLYGKLHSVDGLYCNKNQMLNALAKKYNDDFKNGMERIERLRNQ